MSLFEVNGEDIKLLTPTQLTDLLRKLLNLEASKYGISRSGVNVAGNIDTPDGGVDGSIMWDGDLPHTGFLPSNYLVFQSKAERMTSTSAGNEVEHKPRGGGERHIKRMVDRTLNDGAGYILFCNTDLTDEQRSDAISSIRQKFREHEKLYESTALVDIFDVRKIVDWTNDYLPAVLSVKEWVQKPVPGNLICFDSWRLIHQMEDFEYVEDQNIGNLKESIKSLIEKPGTRSRVIGMSGVGKSRLVYEACKDSEQTHRVVYCDGAVGDQIVLQNFIEIHKRASNSIFILDNCPVDLHAMIVRMAPPKMSLISIDYNNDLRSNSDELEVPSASQEVITRIIKEGWPKISSEQLQRIIDYAEGFPQIAVTLAKDAARGAEDLGRLNDDTIKMRLLGQNATADDLAAIEALSLFEAVGFENEFRKQYVYVAEKIANQAANDFYRSIKRFEKRDLIDSRGDYKRVRPFPLALRLSADWWEQNSSDRIMEVIELIDPKNSPPNLSESFCRAITKLDFVEKAVEITNQICGSSGPFVGAGMLKTGWGTRLFRAFVEVNPTATSNALYSFINKFDKNELYSEFHGDIRRNLYWALEKLCFRKSVFDKAGWVLLRFAAAENESWSNNCSALFRQLFAIRLSGTQAGPDQRFKLLERAITSDDETLLSPVIDALKSALDIGPRSRIVGAEHQGLNQELYEWVPQNREELLSYQDRALLMMSTVAETHPSTHEEIRKALGPIIRTLALRSDLEDVSELLEPFFVRFRRHWPEALASIRLSKKYDLSDSDADVELRKQILEGWENRLQPTGIAEKVDQLVAHPDWEHQRSDEGGFIDIAEQRAVAFAQEIAERLDDLIPHLQLLIKGEVRKGFSFGKELASLNESHSYIIDALLEEFRNIESEKTKNPTVLAGYLSTVKFKNEELFDYYLKIIERDRRLSFAFMPVILGSGLDGDKLERIYALLAKKWIKIQDVRSIAYGQVCSSLDPNVILHFVRKVKSLNKTYVWSCLDIMFMYAFDDHKKWKSIEKEVVDLIISIDFMGDYKIGTMDIYHFEASCLRLVDRHGSLVVGLVLDKIFSLIYSNTYAQWESAASSLIEKLIEKEYYQKVLDRIALALPNRSSIEKFDIENFFGSKSFREDEALLLRFPHDVLIDWMKNGPHEVRVLVAKSCPLYLNKDAGFIVHPLANKIVDLFGEDIEVLKGLSSFAGLKGWVGSRIPDLEGEKAAYEHFASSESPTVSNWAQEFLEYTVKSIEAESRREEAWDLGIH